LLQMVLTCPPRAAAVTTRRARAAPRGAATERAAGARLRGHVMFTLTKVTTFIRGGEAGVEGARGLDARGAGRGRGRGRR